MHIYNTTSFTVQLPRDLIKSRTCMSHTNNNIVAEPMADACIFFSRFVSISWCCLLLCRISWVIKAAETKRNQNKCHQICSIPEECQCRSSTIPANQNILHSHANCHLDNKLNSLTDFNISFVYLIGCLALCTVQLVNTCKVPGLVQCLKSPIVLFVCVCRLQCTNDLKNKIEVGGAREKCTYKFNSNNSSSGSSTIYVKLSLMCLKWIVEWNSTMCDSLFRSTLFEMNQRFCSRIHH